MNDVLYHGTYKPNVDSIMATGLGAKSDAPAAYPQSKRGYVYLASDPEAARKWARDAKDIPDEWRNQIVVLAVDASKLDMSKLDMDENIRIPEYCPECETPVLDRTQPNYVCEWCAYQFEGDLSYQYEGVIPPDAISIYKVASVVMPWSAVLAGNYKIGFTPREFKVAVSLPDLVQQTNAFSTKYRSGCVPVLTKSDPKNLFLQYRVTCHKADSDPRGHETRVQFDVSKIKEDQNANDLDIRVSCSCPAFLYWGAQWNLHQRDGLLGEPRPLLQAPTERLDLRTNFVICKHCKAVFERILPSVQHNINNILRKKKVEEETRRREEERVPPPTIRRQPGQKPEPEEEELLRDEEKKLMLEQEGVVPRGKPATNEEREKHPVEEEVRPKSRWRDTLNRLRERVKGWGVPTPEKGEPKPENEEQRVQDELLREELKKMKMPLEKEHPKEPHVDTGLPYEPKWKQLVKRLRDRIKSWGR